MIGSGYIPDNESVRFLFDDRRLFWIELRRVGTRRLKLMASHGVVLALSSSNMATLSIDPEGVWLEK